MSDKKRAWQEQIIELMFDALHAGSDPYEVLHFCSLLGYPSEDLLQIATAYELAMTLKHILHLSSLPSEDEIQNQAQDLISGLESYLAGGSS